jgi:hypothetical protein
MPYKDKDLAERNMAGVLDDEASGSSPMSLEKDASALARLLVYATEESRVLGSEDAAMLIEEALESLKGQFALKDTDVLPSEASLSH